MIGSGYVGLVTGACFAEMGNDIICVDENSDKISLLQRGEIPIYEPGLKEIIARNAEEGRIRFTTDLKEGVGRSLLCFICVGTPQDKNGSADLTYVLNVASQLGDILDEYRIIVDKSTVPMGTAEKVRDTIKKRLDARGLKHLEFDVISNPEFLKEGNAVQDFMRPDRVIVGTDNVRTAEILKELYSPFVRTTNNPVIVMDIRSAELTKYASNCFLAAKVTFMNELAILCDRLGANIDLVREGMGTDERIGQRFLLAGPGFGGSCFPKDVQALISTARDCGHTLEICEATWKANQRQKQYVAAKIMDCFKGEDLEKITVAVWGLTFKPKTDDVRESPAIDIINTLLDHGMKVVAYDPKGMDNAREIFGNRILYTYDAYEALKGADCLAIVTEWNQFKSPDLPRMMSLLKRQVVVDGRNILNSVEMRMMGFNYHGVGRE